MPVAQHEQALAVSESFAPLMRAAHATTYTRPTGKWERYDEALASVADLPA